MNQYLEVLKYVLKNGEDVSDRTGTNTRTVFGQQMKFNLKEGFPAVTTKKLAWKSVVSELLWFLEGSTDERRLAEILFEKDRKELIDKKTIWTANANKQGKDLGYQNDDLVKELGPIYGYQWRNWETYNPVIEVNNKLDQIQWIINEIKTNPDSRRIILNAWNVADIDKMALPPCHTMAQFKVINGKLSCQLYQRSADMFLGVPFNIASYALLTHMIAQICELEVGYFVWAGGDCHIYHNHIMPVQQQLYRSPKLLPALKMPKFTSLEELLQTSTSDFELEGYFPHGPITAPMAV